MNFSTILVLIIAASAVVSSLKFVHRNMPNSTENSIYADSLVNRIQSGQIQMAVLGNNYRKYPGEIEERDTAEYIEFVKSGVLDLFHN